MIPIRATYHYEEKVEVDYEKEDHMDFVNEPYAVEKRMARGLITDILRLQDFGLDQKVNKVESEALNPKGEVVKLRSENTVNIPMQSEGMYAVFWMETESGYKPIIDGLDRFTVSNADMREYVNRANGN